MTLRTRGLIQQLLIFIIAAVMIFAENNGVALNTRITIVLAVLSATLAITVVAVRRKGKDAHLLLSPLDYGWLPFVLLTGLTVVTAQFPRRSVEAWLWTAAIQLPMAYVAIVMFRKGWEERSLYRTILGIGGLLYLLALRVSLGYFSAASAYQASGLIPPGFRLFGVLTHPNILAIFIAISSPCIVGYLFLPLKRTERILAGLWLVGAVLSLYGTGSRNGTVSTLAGVGIALSLSLVAHRGRPLARLLEWSQARRAQASVLGALGGLFLIGAFAGILAIQWGRPEQDSGGGRLSFFREAIEMFKDRPLVGSGPSSFVLDELRTQSVPSYPLMGHAHDSVLNSAAESGLMGLIGILALFGVGALVCIRAWRTQPNRRASIAGPIGGLLAFALSGILDSTVNLPSAFFLAALLLAFVAAGLPAPQTAARWRVSLIVATAWAVPVLCALLLIPYSQLWNILESKTPPIQAAKQIDAISGYDPNDGLVRLQSAYYWGQAAYSDNGQALQTAISRFEQAIPFDPYLSLHYLNLAVMYRQAGRLQDALISAETATRRAPDDAVTWLNAGYIRELNGDSGAETYYLEALKRDAQWAQAGFWRSTPLRQAALRKFYESVDKLQVYDTAISTGNAALRDGKTDEAIEAYEAALQATANPDQPLYVQGLLALAKGDRKGAQVALQQLTVTGSGDPVVDAWLRLGDMAIQRGDQNEGLQDYNTAYRAVADRGIGGYGSQGNYGYAMVSFGRAGLIGDYLPGVLRLDVSPDRAARFKLLAKSLLNTYKVSETMQLYQLILQSNPQDADAQKALSDLAPI